MTIDELKVVISASTSNFDSAMSKVGQKLDGVTGKADKTGSALMTKLGGSISTLIPKLGAFISKIAGVVGAISSVGTGVTAVIGALAVAVGGLALAYQTLQLILVRIIPNLDRSNSSMSKMTGTVGRQLDELVTSAINVSTTVPQSMDEVTFAVGELNTRLGLTGELLETTSTQFLNFARINDIEVAEAVTITSQMMNALGADGEDASSILDKLTFASQETGIGVTDLADYIISAGYSFQSLGFDIDRSIALFSTFEKAGSRPEQILSAITLAMNYMVDNGLEPSEEAFMGLIEQIQYAETEAEALTLSNEMFGRMFGGKIMDDIRAGRFEIEAWTEAIRSADGTVEQTAMASMTIGERVKQLGNTINASLAPIAEVIRRFVNVFLMGIQLFFEAYGDRIRAITIKIAGFLLFIGRTIIMVLKSLPFIGRFFAQAEDALNALGSAMGQASQQANNAGGSMDSMADGMDNATGKAKDLNKELLGLAGFDEMNVLTQAKDAGSVGGLGSVPSMGVGIPEIDFEGITDEFDNMWQAILESADGFQQEWNAFWNDPLGYLREQWSKAWTPFYNWVSVRWESFKNMITSTWDYIKEWVIEKATNTWNGIMGSWTTFNTRFVEGWNVLKSRVIGIVSGIWSSVTTWFIDMRNNLIARAREIWSNIASRFGAIKDSVLEKARSLRDTLLGIWRHIRDTVSGIVEHMWVQVSNRFKSGINWAIQRINSFINSINSLYISIPRLDIYINPNIGHIPYLAQGGVIDSPTVAMVGEAGREVVMPLENNTQWISELAEKINTQGGGGGTLVVKIGEDTIFEKAIDYIKERGIRTGSNLLNL